MKKFIIISIILGVFTVYFIFNTEKSISIKDRGNAIPVGIDLAKLILNKAKTIIEPDKIISNITSNINNKTSDNNLIKESQSNITEEIKSKAEEIKDKIFNEGINLIKQPIENKINEVFCPQK